MINALGIGLLEIYTEIALLSKCYQLDLE